MKANEVMEKYDITRMTLCRWVKEGKIKYEILPSGRYDYISHIDKYQEKEDIYRQTVLYCRDTQNETLDKQIERVKSFASSKGIKIDAVYSEVASPLNYNRRYYRKLYKEIIEKRIKMVIVEYKDCILRVGFDDFLELCKLHNTEVLVLDESIDKSKQYEIVDDIIFIIHQFSDKIYSNKRRKDIEILVRKIAEDKENA